MSNWIYGFRLITQMEIDASVLLLFWVYFFYWVHYCLSTLKQKLLEPLNMLKWSLANRIPNCWHCCMCVSNVTYHTEFWAWRKLLAISAPSAYSDFKMAASCLPVRLYGSFRKLWKGFGGVWCGEINQNVFIFLCSYRAYWLNNVCYCTNIRTNTITPDQRTTHI